MFEVSIVPPRRTRSLSSNTRFSERTGIHTKVVTSSIVLKRNYRASRLPDVSRLVLDSLIGGRFCMWEETGYLIGDLLSSSRSGKVHHVRESVRSFTVDRILLGRVPSIGPGKDWKQALAFTMHEFCEMPSKPPSKHQAGLQGE